MIEMIWMEHPGLGPDRKQQVPLKAFKNAWSKAGWKLTDAPEPEEDEWEIELEEESQDLEDLDYPDDEPEDTEEE
jgi:hypothetical protein